MEGHKLKKLLGCCFILPLFCHLQKTQVTVTVTCAWGILLPLLTTFEATDSRDDTTDSAQ